ncbi:GTP 3',8-cyclase MoaA [Paenibacillus sp. CN-4]|uniref:GTP 3',8-cyclase MoaA n=1 Tax=Paenibacillus nanchangensis TaxID=3348343 RepID=UPI00397C1413
MTTVPLTDRLGRPMQDLRISVTDRCNFRCSYCMPPELFGDDYPFLPKTELLSYEEILRLAGLFASLGIRKIRLTGGEPLLRRDLPKLVAGLTQVAGIREIGLTTNGLLLGKYAEALVQAGLRRVNVSLDALDAELFGRLNGRGIRPDTILNQIDEAVRAGLEVKVNMVVQKGINDGEILPMAACFKQRGIPLRFIEFMDVGNDNGWSFRKVVTKEEILERLREQFDLEPVGRTYYGEVAQIYRYKDNGAQIGLIPSVSESFCSSCTRIRLSSEGKLYTCLFAGSGFDLKEQLRSGQDDETLLQSIRQVWQRRSDRYSDERTEQTAASRNKIRMSYIGG